VKYAYLAQQREQRGAFPVRLMCRALGVSPAGYYAWRTRRPSARVRADGALRARVERVHARSGGTYGAPRVRQALRARGERVGTKRVARLMREAGLVGRPRRRLRGPTTQSGHAYPVAPNQLARRFGLTDIGGLDRAWVSDLTYVPTREGWLYLATVLDLASRRVVGWAMRDTLETDVALSALRMALTARRPPPGLVHHSDRGVQYARGEYQALLAQHGLVPSMSRKGNCWDNAVAESFFATLEWELLQRHDWRTRTEARSAIFAYIEGWYNRERLHSTLGYRSPAQYEADLRRHSAA